MNFDCLRQKFHFQRFANLVTRVIHRVNRREYDDRLHHYDQTYCDVLINNGGKSK